MGIPVKLQVFEGPLDLLLHLIDKNKVNIYDIPIVEITNQYLEYIQEMKRQDLNIMSEFLVMAATLIDIKSKMLLPKEVNEDGEEEDPRQELVEKLLEYKLYKFMSYELKDREEDAAFTLYKPPTIPEEVAKYRPKADINELLEGLTLSKLHAVFKSIIKLSLIHISGRSCVWGNQTGKIPARQKKRSSGRGSRPERRIKVTKSLFNSGG